MNFILISFLLTIGHISKIQNEIVKLNIKEIPINPFNSSDVLEIKMMIFVLDLEPFKELDMDYRIDYLLRQIWIPHSNYCLAIFDDMEISPLRKEERSIVLYDETDLNKIWIPDSFASNSKDERISSNTDYLERILISMFSSKKCVIEYWSKLNAKLSCGLNFHFYPFDEQYCNMTIRNYAVNEKLLRYKWLDKESIDWRDGFENDRRVFLTDGVVLMYPLRLVQYEINAISGTFIDEMKDFRFSSLFVTFIYKRKIFGNIIEVYLPSILLLTVSWTSLWIHIDEVGRVLNCMTCFLSLITQFIHVRSRIPAIIYINGIDIWMLTCLTFVFANLLQFTLVKYLQQNALRQDQQREQLANRRKSSLSDDKALNAYLIQRNRERFRMISKLKLLNKNKNRALKRLELVKYLAVLKIPRKDQVNVETNQRLDFVTKKDVVRNYKSFLSSQYFDGNSPFEFDQKDMNNNYDRVLKDRLDRLVKYNSSSSSSSSNSEDSEEEESWFKKIKNDHEVNELVDKVDQISKVAFFLAFLLFNLVYWPYMIYSSR